jgi:eukaryotic-like serine/threonine-protein kinase
MEGDPLELRQQRCQRRLSQHVSPIHQARIIEFLGVMMGIPPLNGGSPALRTAKRDAQIMHEQMRRAFEDWLEAESIGQPILLLLEDLHWGDAATVRFVDGALKKLKDKAFLVVALARPEVHELFPKLWSERGTQEMKLQGLSKRATEKLIRQILSEKATPEVIAAIQEKSAGNAFFLEELIRAVHHGKDQLPETILAMTSSRIEELSSEERKILRAASIFGETFWYEGLVRLLGGEDIPFDLSANLQMLVKREFIHVATDSFSSQEYRFRHTLLRETAYASLTEVDRKLGHRLAAQWLVSNPGSEPAVLAEHLERAGLSNEAIRYYRDAAKDALQADDLSLVHSRYHRAIKCGASGEILAEFDTMIAESYAWQGDFLAAKKVFLEAQQKSTPQSVLWWKATGGLALTSIFSSDLKLLPIVMEQFESYIPSDEAGDVYVVAAARTVPPWLMLGQKARATFLWENIRKLTNKTPPLEPDAHAWMIITRGSISFWRDANPWTAYADYQSAIHIFEEIGATRSASIAKYFPVPALRALGLLQEAEERLRENIETLPSTDSFTRCYCYISLCEILAIQGRTAEALKLEPLLQQNVGNNFFMMQASKLSMAQVYFAAQDFASARQRLDAIWGTPFPILEAVANVLQAKMYLVEQQPRKALPHAEKAFEYVVTHGTGGSFAPRAACLSYAFTLDALDRQPEAREIIMSTYQELCTIAAHISDEHYRKSFLEGAYENAGVIQLAQQWGIAP